DTFELTHTHIREMMTLAVLNLIGPYNPTPEQLHEDSEEVKKTIADIVSNLLQFIQLDERKRQNFILSEPADKLRNRIHTLLDRTVLTPFVGHVNNGGEAVETMLFSK